MAGQLIGLLFCGLLAAHLIALLLTSGGGEPIHALSRRQMLDRIPAIYRLAQIHPDDATLKVLDSATARFRTGPNSAIAALPPHGELMELHAALCARVGLTGDDVRLQRRDRDGEDPELAIAMRLADGRWLNSVQRPVVVNRSRWWRPLQFSIPVSTLPVLVIGIVFVRRILRPIRALSAGAERVSRGDYSAPLPLTGPREAREVTASFNLMQARLTSYIEDHKQMLASISHDLRSMVTSLRLRAELVDEPELRTAMQRTLKDMAGMIEETLRFSKDDAYDEPTTDVDLGRLLADIAADQAAQGRDVMLVAGGALAPLPYRCRPLAIKRAFTNLVDNAVRYGHCARIVVEPDGDAVRVLVEDEGPGIAPAQLETVFKPFFRLDQSRQPALGGVGLGLAIARSCVEAHGGKLTLENRNAGGLRAVVVLPA